MAMHLFGMLLTHHGIFANNRGDTEGNTTTLHKLIINGEIYTTVSSESIRYALREIMQEKGYPLNRMVKSHNKLEFKDREFKKWKTYYDDDIFGFLHARKETLSRRGILEVSRAVSLTPWRGEVDHHFATPGSNPGVTHSDPIPYSVEVHATRYQFGFAMTPKMLGKESMDEAKELKAAEKLKRVEAVLNTIVSLRRVGGNHARYYSDFSSEAVVYRWTDDPAPRFLYCFKQGEDGSLGAPMLMSKINAGDINPEEIIIGTGLHFEGSDELKEMGVAIYSSVKEATKEVLKRIEKSLKEGES